MGSSLDYSTRRLVEKVQRIEDAACTICKTVVSTIDDFISDDATEKQIKVSCHDDGSADSPQDGLETVCSILPSSMEKMCDSMVDTYLDLAVQIVTKVDVITQSFGSSPFKRKKLNQTVSGVYSRTSV